jgi:hypothetical protein
VDENRKASAPSVKMKTKAPAAAANRQRRTPPPPPPPPSDFRETGILCSPGSGAIHPFQRHRLP